MYPPAEQVVRYFARCSASQLDLGFGGPFNEPTGQRSLSMTLTNKTATGCYLYGYPGIRLIDDHSGVLPLDYRWSGDQVVTSNPPTQVDLHPGGTAYVTVNKYRCDASILMHATGIRVIPPDDTTPLQRALPVEATALDYCGAGDPGSDLAISPVGATSRATQSH